MSAELDGGSHEHRDPAEVVGTRDRPGHPIALELRANNSGAKYEPNPIRCRICGADLDVLDGGGSLAYHLTGSAECREAIRGWLTDRRERRHSPEEGVKQ